MQKTSKRPLLKDRAYAELKALIQGGTFKPGDFLSERQLAEELNMSKTPVRSALERLESEGFVVISPQQGIVVRELSLQEIVDLFDIRVALETFTVRKIAGKLTPPQAAELQANLDAQAEGVRTQDVASAPGLDAEFHLLLSRFLDNQEILRSMLQLQDKLHRIVSRISQRNPARMHTSYEEHQAIADAVMAGDGDLAAERVVQHLEFGKRFLVSD